MKKETELELDSLLNENDRRLTERKKKSEERQYEAKALSGRFEHVRAEMIRPVMEDIGNKLQTRGHSYEIREDNARDVGDRIKTASITMWVYFISRESFGHGRDYAPRVSFVHSGNNVERHEWVVKPSGVGIGGTCGSFKLNELSKDIIEQEVLDFIRENLKAAP